MSQVRTPPALPRVPVAIVGAGPVGLALALGLARHGVGSTVVERDATTSARSRAAGIHVRTREALRRWGVERALLDAGHLVSHLEVRDVRDGDRALISADLGTLDDEADRPGLLMLEQSETERLLLRAARDTGLVDVRFATTLTHLHHREHDVTLSLERDGATEHLVADLVAGCDGASSTVRDAVGLPFEGSTYRLRPLLADLDIDDQRDALPWPRFHDGPDGITFALRLRPGRWRLVHLATDEEAGHHTDHEGGDAADDEVARRAADVLGPGPVSTVWASRFRIHRRAAPRFRAGRVLLVGDAAHVHSPVGAFGMNAGIQDAQNLAWKLAAVVHGGDLDRLLDSYDVERRAVVADTIAASTDLVTRLVLQAPPSARSAAFAAQRAAMRVPAVRRRALRRVAMLDLDLPPSPLLGARHRAAGVRLPDVRLRGPDGTSSRLHTLLPVGAALLQVDAVGRPVPPGLGELPVDEVLRIGPGGHRDPSGRLRELLAGHDGWILVRPDGHVAWARTREDQLAHATRVALGRLT